MSNVLIIVFLISFLFIIFSWIFMAVSSIKKRRLSNAYGFLAISYIIHAFVLKIIHEPNGFYIVFSLFFLFFHIVNRNLENISDKSNINKKEDNL